MTTTDTDGHTTTATDTTAMHDSHGHDHAQSRHTQSRMQRIAPAIAHDTPTNKQTNVLMLQHTTNTPRGGASPRPAERGRWVSGLKAECDFRGYLEKLGHGATGWNGAVFAVLASWCGELVWHI